MFITCKDSTCAKGIELDMAFHLLAEVELI